MVSKPPDIDIRVDLRKFWVDVRDQGGRPSCLACASSDAHGHSQDCGPLSAEFLFYHAGQLMPSADVSGGITFGSVDKALKVEGQPDEKEWPYQANQPTPWTPPLVTRLWHGKTASNTATGIVASLNANQPVVLGLKLTPDFHALSPPFVIPATGRGFGGHAVLAVGWAECLQTGPLLLIRNSWGPSWGDSGYAWLRAAYLNDKLIDCRTIQSLKSK